MRGVALSVGFLMLSLSVVHGQVGGLPHACTEYAEYMSSDDTVGALSETCIPYEEMILTSRNWRGFVWNFERYFSKDGFPLQVEIATHAARNNNDGRALVHFDMALENAIQIFVNKNDLGRAKVYTYLIVSTRNSILRKYISDEPFWTELAKVKPPALLSGFSRDRLEKAYFLKCLIRLDAWTLPIGEVIQSPPFEMCINEAEE